MRNRKIVEADFIIDKLTKSIEEVSSGQNISTLILPLKLDDLLGLKWQFDWELELEIESHFVYKLVAENNPNLIQGLICLERKPDHIYIHLLESSSFNKGSQKQFLGVAGNLVAYACKQSFHFGNDGNVSFIAKEQLINHYERSIGAFHFGNKRMIINTNAAKILVNQYFNS
ncbi:MAG: hypothetical protein RLZZ209_689 [Bacteroidota bacterium]|jgi:hypothetical protein